MKTESRTLKYAILGLLIRHPLTGYDITKEFEKDLYDFWTARHSQIYPELKRLLEEKLVTCQIEISGESLQKKVYSITPAGVEDFSLWLGRIDAMDPPPRDVFRLRMYFFHHLDQKDRLCLLQDQRRQHEERLLHLKEKYRKYEDCLPGPDNPDCGDYLVLTGAILREETHIRWLDSCIAFFDPSASPQS